MKALVIYESMFGNTEKVAMAIAVGLGEFVDVEVHDVREAPAEPDVDVGLTVVGGPTHAFSMTRERTRADAVKQGARGGTPELGLREWLAGVGTGSQANMLATFDTRVAKVRRLPGSAAKAAAKVARRRGWRLVARPESFYVTDVAGPLLPGELDRATTWARKLGSNLAGTSHAEDGHVGP